MVAIAVCAPLLAACQASVAVPTSPPACVDAARNYNGSVVAYLTTTLGVVRGYSSVVNEPTLSKVSADTPALICYIDGEIGKAPPPPVVGSPPPPFDRAVVVAVAGTATLVIAGYQANIPLPSPSAPRPTT